MSYTADTAKNASAFVVYYYIYVPNYYDAVTVCSGNTVCKPFIRNITYYRNEQ